MSKLEMKRVFIREFPEPDKSSKDIDIDNLSIIDIQAAIAKQGIPISELFSRQDLAANREVMTLVHEAESKAKNKLEKEIIVLTERTKSLQSFRDKAETITLVESSKILSDKGDRIVQYIKARLSTGRGVDLAGDLSNEQRQDKVNEAIELELKLMDDQGIEFKKKGEVEEKFEDPFEDEVEDEDFSNPDVNPLIPSAKS